MLRPTAAVLLLIGLAAGCGQQFNTTTQSSLRPRRRTGVVDDWSMHHVKFSNPGTEADAIRNGSHDKWLRIVNDPRYQMQQAARSAQWVTLGSRRPRDRFPNPPTFRHPFDPMHRDWAYQIAPAGAGYGEELGSFPAKYGLDINATPSCSDYVVFPVMAPGSSTQANIVGFDNLYDGTCPSSAPSGQPFAPTVKFAYSVDTGGVYGSPVLSEDGTKVAFVAYNSNGITLHVLTLGTEGDNGTSYNSPQKSYIEIQGGTPTITGADNNAIDISLTLSTSTTLRFPFSSPFVDYSDDIAYVGDIAAGVLYKVTGVFRSTPTEVTTGGWPFTVSSEVISSPVYDSVSRHIFGTSSSGSSGSLWCIDVSSGTPAFCSTPDVSIGHYLYDGPIVDSTAGTVFAEALIGSYPYTPTLTQTTTNLGNEVQASMGTTTVGGYQFSGDFDNTYYSGNYASGYMYFCGVGPVLYRIGFNTTGKMNSANDGNKYEMSSYGYCTPLTEAYNSRQGKDYLFLGVSQDATPAGCDGGACVMSIELGSSFPSGTAATLPLGGNGYLSGIVIDNVSTAVGASQIYFSNGTTGSATQASQNGLN